MYDPTRRYARTLSNGDCRTLAFALLRTARKSTTERGYFPYAATDRPRIETQRNIVPQDIIAMFQQCTQCRKPIGNTKTFLLPLVEVMHDPERFDALVHTLMEHHRQRPECRPPRPVRPRPRRRYSFLSNLSYEDLK
jgi:hypothetical protein